MIENLMWFFSGWPIGSVLTLLVCAYMEQKRKVLRSKGQ